MGRKLDTLRRNLALCRYKKPELVAPVMATPVVDQPARKVYISYMGTATSRAVGTMLDQIKPGDTFTLEVDMHQCRCPVLNTLHPVPMDHHPKHLIKLNVTSGYDDMFFMTEDCLFIDGIRLKGKTEVMRLAIPMTAITSVAYTNKKGEPVHILCVNTDDYLLI